MGSGTATIPLADRRTRSVPSATLSQWDSLAAAARGQSEGGGEGEASFLRLMPLLDAMLGRLVRGSGLLRADAEDFISDVRARFIEDDYAITRTCLASAEPRAYVAATLAHLLCDFRNERWGRWRPSATAKRLGPSAIKLEQLMERDGTSMLEAVRMVCSADPSLVEADVIAMARDLPRRPQAREIDLTILPVDQEGAPTANPDLDDLGARITRALSAALAGLPPEDLLIMRFHFCDGLTIAQISRILNLKQKPLYRRMLHIEETLRHVISTHGIGAAEARDAVMNHFMTSIDWCGS
jgi:RNA polymerase sigma factor (sigma-70 family)